ncbi:hypothetical protein CJF42_18465 [Pseudoalteromonas sp. NBT06-2]|uniref:hypothetical protein n=1 Tax=Pseudoalteromonas sp. NBT06-2 TaxID=2025950 RepID=UPI000BA5D957|nr:hypothetical protein [Pseudoalteromonas sp. NBT06-2]PAJ72932.1 hypothetical protein CJF42_18465 [Pseudoalteromonas sp. NBT06-2]
MICITMTISVLFLWIGCLAVFLSSPNQKLLIKRPSKNITWAIFTVFCVFSWYLLLNLYPAVTSGLVVLSLVMAFWTIIIIAHGHLKIKFLPFACIGAVFSLALAQLGGL